MLPQPSPFQSKIVLMSAQKSALYHHRSPVSIWAQEGRLVHREAIFKGIEYCVDAMNGLFPGASIGKMLVSISQPSSGGNSPQGR